MLSNRPEFHLADLAVMALGATPFSIYQTFTREQIEYVVGDAGAKVALIEAEYARSLPGARARARAARTGGPPVEGFEPPDVVEPDDLVTLIYTSGTTGPPKGVQLTHANVMAAVGTVDGIIEFPDGAKVISWLPAAHIAERMAHHYLPIALGDDRHDVPEPARGGRLPARGASRPGSSPCRGSGRS